MPDSNDQLLSAEASRLDLTGAPDAQKRQVHLKFMQDSAVGGCCCWNELRPVVSDARAIGNEVQVAA